MTEYNPLELSDCIAVASGWVFGIVLSYFLVNPMLRVVTPVDLLIVLGSGLLFAGMVGTCWRALRQVLKGGARP